jgi:hypothetical protein
MYRIVIVILIYYRHKPIDIIHVTAVHYTELNVLSAHYIKAILVITNMCEGSGVIAPHILDFSTR